VEDDYVRFNNAFRYDAGTGKIYWKVSPRYGVMEGDVAGHKGPQEYWTIKLRDVSYRAHRVAWLLYYGKWPSKQIDHINGIRDDNRICNLRDISQRENCCNRVEHRNGNKVGASFSQNRWRSHITINDKMYNLGHYDTQEEATQAYKVALKTYQDDPTWVPTRISKGYFFSKDINKYEVRVQIGK